jgi:hypothetical protein
MLQGIKKSLQQNQKEWVKIEKIKEVLKFSLFMIILASVADIIKLLI